MESTESREAALSRETARELLVHTARALAHTDGLGPSLDTLLGVIAAQLDIESAVVVVVDGPDRLGIVAAVGLGEPAEAGLAQALRNPGHPIARTLREPVPSFDVLPSVPGGPALRSHLPLAVTRAGTTRVLGVLALAHHRPLDPEARALLEAAADLAAIAVERDRPSR
jgi:GAF domain-containing protein